MLARVLEFVVLVEGLEQLRKSRLENKCFITREWYGGLWVINIISSRGKYHIVLAKQS